MRSMGVTLVLVLSLSAVASAWGAEIGDVLMATRDAGPSFGGFPIVYDEDVMALKGSSSDPIASGAWSLMFDGTSAGVWSGTGYNALHYIYTEESGGEEVEVSSLGSPAGGRSPTPGVPDLFFSLSVPHTIQGTYYNNNDIAAYDEDTGNFSMFFNGQAHGLELNDLDALAIYGSSIILSVRGNEAALPGLGYVRGEDLVAFTPNVDGDWNGAGVWSMFLDGSDIGLDRGVEDIDGAEVMSYLEAKALGLDVEELGANPELPVVFFSTESLTGDLNVASGGLVFEDEDIVAFLPTSLGWDTAGTGVLYMDGSAVGLASCLDAETNAFAIVAASGGGVPEPGTIALLVTGSMMLLGFGYRRRRHMA